MKLHWSWASGLALVLSTDMLYVFCFTLCNWVLAKCMDSGGGKTRPEVSIQIERYKSRRAQALEIPCLGLHALPLMEYYFTGWQKNIIIIDKNLVTHSSLLICLGHLACKRQTLLLAHGRWGKFHEEEHPRLSSRNSILMMSINVNIINLVVIGLQMQICSILCFSWSILVKCCVHLQMSSSKTQMLPLEKTRFHKYWLFC